jgi:hypothetical protein
LLQRGEEGNYRHLFCCRATKKTMTTMLSLNFIFFGPTQLRRSSPFFFFGYSVEGDKSILVLLQQRR